MQRTAIIVPCYNESQRLKGHEFTYYARKNRWVYFIFVNDGSTDNTQEIIDELCSTDSSQITSIRHTKNLGKAEAVRRGFLQAIEMGVENIGYWDADLSTPLHSIDSLCGVLANDKITTVMGSRVKLLGRRIERLAIRHYLGRVFATFASLLLRLPIYDTQCGAKIFKNNDDIRKVFSLPFNVNWTFDVEILARLRIIYRDRGSNFIEESIVEYPLEEWVHVADSKIKVGDCIFAALELVKLFFLLYAPRISSKYLNRLEN